MAQNYGLGRGLSSLIPQKKKRISEPEKNFNYFGLKKEVGSEISDFDEKQPEIINSANIIEIDISRITPNPHQPRVDFNETKLSELAHSIKEHGIIQPLVVSQKKDGFEIIAGERRFQAAKLAGLKTVPAIKRDAEEKEKLELAIIENIQRHDLNVIEEARAYQKLTDNYQMNQEEISLKMGKSRSAIANKIRLLGLPIEIQKSLIEGKITEGHAKSILAISNPEKQRALFEMILKESLTVRQTEDRVREISVRSHKRQVNIDPEIKAIEDKLASVMGTKVKVIKSGEKGRIIIDYFSEEEFNNILRKMLQ